MPRTSLPRVTPYQARIERTLTDVYQEVPERWQADAEWILTHVLHINAYTQCELCGHYPIRRLFFIKNQTTGDEKCIGSECARNYVRVDLVQAYERSLNRAQGRIRRNRERQALQEAATARANARRAQIAESRTRWRSENADIVTFVEDTTNQLATRFIVDMAYNFRYYHTLTPAQVAAVRRIMDAAGRDALRRTAVEQAQRADDAEGLDGEDVQGAIEVAADAGERMTVAQGEHIHVSFLSAAQGATTAFQNVAAVVAASETSEEATTHQARSVPNGSFVVTIDDERIELQVYTATMGALRGKRLIKVRDSGGIGGWRAFAFLTTSGHLRLWRRFALDNEALYVRAARQMLTLFRDIRDPALLGHSIDIRNAETEIRVRGQNACRVCNGNLSGFSPQAEARGYCHSHASSDPERPVTPDRSTVPSSTRRSRESAFAAATPDPLVSEVNSNEIR